MLDFTKKNFGELDYASTEGLKTDSCLNWRSHTP